MCVGLIGSFGLPGFVEGDDELAVEEAFEVGLAGEGEVEGAFGSEDEVFAVEEVDAAGEDGGVVALGVVEGEAVGADVGLLAAEDLFCGVEGVPRFHSLTTKG